MNLSYCTCFMRWSKGTPTVWLATRSSMANTEWLSFVLDIVLAQGFLFNNRVLGPCNLKNSRLAAVNHIMHEMEMRSVFLAVPWKRKCVLFHEWNRTISYLICGRAVTVSSKHNFDARDCFWESLTLIFVAVGNLPRPCKMPSTFRLSLYDVSDWVVLFYIT